MARPIHSVHEENVRPAVIVVIDESDARPQSLRQEFLPKRSVVMDEMNPGLLRDIAKRHSGAGRASCAFTCYRGSSRERKRSQQRWDSPHWALMIQSRPTPRASATRLM